MGGLIVPYFAAGSGAEIIIDGVTYKVPLIDSGGRVYTNAYATGASEVLSRMPTLGVPSTTRITAVTPAAGKRLRLISYQLSNSSVTAIRFEVYFGAGANIAVDLNKAVADIILDIDNIASTAMVWPDGGGPVGAVNEVLSFRTTIDVGANAYGIIHYREE